MKYLFSKATAVFLAAVLVIPNIPVFANTETNLGNMFGSTTFADDGTVTLDSDKVTASGTLTKVVLSDGAALKVTGLEASEWGSPTIKRIWFGEQGHQYLVSAKVKTVNMGETTKAWFQSSNPSASKDKADSNYNYSYNNNDGNYSYVAASVDSEGWQEIYAVYALIENDSSKTRSGIHIDIRLSSATDVYIKDFNVVETNTLDNLLLGPLDPAFENSESLYINSKMRPQYSYTSLPSVVEDSAADNSYVKLTGFSDADGTFRLKSVPVSAGKKYVIGMDVKLPANSEEGTYQASLSSQWLDDAVFTPESEPTLSATQWKRVSGSVVSKISDIADINLRISGMSDGTVLVDNLYMKEVSSNQVYIVSTEPLNNATAVPINQKLKIKFSGAVNSFGVSNISVTGVTSDEKSDTDVTVASVTPLENNTYEIEVSGLDYEGKYTVGFKDIVGTAGGNEINESISFTAVSETVVNPDPEPETEYNLLTGANWDFEQDIVSENGSPGYCKLHFKGSTVTAESVAGDIIFPAYHGTKYASVSGRSAGTDGIRFVFAPATELGVYYRASARVRLPERTTDTVTARISMGNYGSNTVVASPLSGENIELKPYEWVEVSHIFAVTPKLGATEPYVSKGMHLELITSHTGDIHLDDFRLEKYVPEPLTVVQSVPAADAEDVALDDEFTVTFNNPLKSNLTAEQVSINNGAVVTNVTKGEYGNTFILTIDKLRYDNEYKITLADIDDFYGDNLGEFEYSFTTCERPETVNLVVNPGFEELQNNKWYFGGGGYSTNKLVELNGGDDPSAHWIITTEDSYSGNYSIKCSGERCGCQLYYTGIPVEANKQYVFSFAANPTTSANVYLRQQSQSGAPAFEDTRTTLSSTGKWEKHTVVFNTLENTNVRVYVGHNGNGTNYYDDFFIAKYDTFMDYAYFSVADGETEVPVNVNKITIAMTNVIAESERSSIVDKFTIDGGASIASAEVIEDGSVIELTLNDNLKNSTTYTLNCAEITDEFGIESSDKTISFTTASAIEVVEVPAISGTEAAALVENCSEIPAAAPVLIYAEYDENNEIVCVKASDIDAEIPAFTEYTCKIEGVPSLDTGHTAMLYLIRSESDMSLLAEPAGTQPEFSQTNLYENRINPQSDTVTLGGIADKNSDILVAILKPMDATKNAANVTAYNPASENKITVQSLLSSSHTSIDETNLQSYVCHLLAVTTNENGEYSVTLPLSKISDKTVYGVLAAKDGFDGDAAALYIPSAESYSNATAAVDAGSSEADITNVLDNFAADLGISLASPVYSLRKSNIITALKSEYPAGGYSDYTTPVTGSFRNNFLKVLAYYERQEEALAAINNASNEGLTAILTEYSDVLGEYGQTLLNFNAKYTQYGEVNINRQLIGTTYESMKAFVDKFNSTVYIAPQGNNQNINSPSGNSGSGGGISKGAAFEVMTLPEAEKELFSDLYGYDWAKDSIISLANRGVINGMGDGTFVPGGNVTREQFVKMLVLAFGMEISEGENVFEDADSSAWYAPYINTAYKSGIVKGVSDTEFGVGSSITRQDMAVMIARACELLGKELVKTRDVTFADGHTVSDYANDAVNTLAEAGIINGVEDGIMAPFELASRAQVAVILDRLG